MNSKDLICQHKDCKLILENPVNLPCGNSICKHHFEQISKSGEKYDCFFCQELHEIPKNGFGVNKILALLIQKYLESDPMRKEIIESYQNLLESIKSYETIVPDSYIYEYFEEIRIKVDLHREELIKEINDRSDEIIKLLKDKEQSCNLNSQKMLPKINLSRIESWKRELRTAEKTEHELNKLLNDIDDKKTEIERKAKQIKNDLLQGESIEFDQFEKSTLFGQLLIEKNNNYLISNECGKLIRSFNQHTLTINSIQVDENSNKLITASDDKTIKIWDLETGECLKTLNDHKNYVNCILIISNNRFMSGSEDKTIKIWDLNTYECLNTLENDSKVSSLCLISESQVACSCLGGSIHIWDLNSFKNVKSFRAHDDWIKYLLLVDKTKLVSCSISGKIKVWSLDTFECINVLEGHSDIVFYLELNSKGNLVSCSEDKTIKIWQIETGEMLKSIEFKNPVNCTQLLNDSLLAAALDNGHIVIFDLNKMEIIQIISAHSTFVYRLLFIPNGNLLIGSGSGIISQWKIVD